MAPSWVAYFAALEGIELRDNPELALAQSRFTAFQSLHRDFAEGGIF